MKNILAALLFLSLNATGQNWQTLGNADFSAGNADFTCLAVSSVGTPYVIYCDYANSNKATVMKHNGSLWENVGSPGFSAGEVHWTSIAIGSGDTPYVAFNDHGHDNKAVVMKYNGLNWVYVGSTGLSSGEAASTSIIIDRMGTPYVIYGDYGDTINWGSATVMKFNGSNWEKVGSSGFSTGQSWGYNKWIAADDAGKLYMAYENGSSGVGPVSAMKFNDSTWINLGIPNFSAGSGQNPSIAINKTGTPYVAYQDIYNSSKATVMKYDGTGWAYVGGAGFSSAGVYVTSIVIDSQDIPYVAFQDDDNGGKATVMKYYKGNWVTVGHAGFTDSAVCYTSLAQDAAGTLYLAFSDYAHDGKVKVMTFKENVGLCAPSIASNYNIYPNPTNSSLTISSPNSITRVNITNLLGQNLFHYECESKEATFDLTYLPAGIYLVHINDTEVRRIVKE